MDNKHHTTRDLTETHPSRLSALMGLDAQQSLWSEADLAAILRHLLETPISTQTGQPDHRQTFGQLFAARKPSIEHLRTVKEFAKSARIDPDVGLPADIATVIYYATLIAARLRCKQAISQLSDPELRDGIDWTLSRPWLPDTLTHLFRIAKEKLDKVTR
jgi:hypothetical protein